jgi:hypothetical protein
LLYALACNESVTSRGFTKLKLKSSGNRSV